MSSRTDTAAAIPVLDLGPAFAGIPGALEETAAKLRHINETVGFLYIANHGVPADLIEATFAQTARFHAQPLERKLALKVDANMQGYLPMRGSTTRSSTIAQGNKPNENEAFFVKRETPGAETSPNRWPEDLPEFRATALAYFGALEALAKRMLPIYARALDLPADYFDALCNQPFSSLRLTHYPSASYSANEYGIAPHTDSSFITLLAQNKVPGLQIRTQEGEWIDAPVIEDTFVVNTGDVLHRWTNGRFLSTAHRAFNTTPTPRYAIPYFFHPNPDTLIKALPTCVDANNPPRFPEQTVAEYMAWFRGQNYDHLRKAQPPAAAE
ncbi:isopenicillin N synthase family dioxygenase [Roseomonas populi]|uniref:2-oxoglutarate-dependent ethylene/succinate-forming enzyme n=1 Tax=Roseomonas populi TaxID=3121582 RepID=A0ABT1X6L9_9PROT|nr:2OG-Fe(II) oxygenase family protein [Roseomonas pecuniae]MCR0983751.1 hypothetical protein [Roseomonas pecuniae]